MALIKCENCGHLISDKAEACPKCGQARTTNAPRTEIKYFEEDSNDEPERNGGGGLKWLIVVIIVLVVGGGVGYYFYSDHKAKEEAAMLAEKARLDSIAAAEAALEAARLDSIRRDSIKYEKEHRFLPTVFIPEKPKKWINDPNCYERSLKSNWKQTLLSQGFVKGKTRIKWTNVPGNGDGLNDIYAISYTRTVNGRSITIDHYEYRSKGYQSDYTEDDSYDDRTFDIIFSDTKDLELFWNTLKRMGMKDYDWYRGVRGESVLNDDRNVCPFCTFIRNGNIITIYVEYICDGW